MRNQTVKLGKLILYLSNYALKKNKKALKYAKGVDISNWTAKSGFIALKIEVEKLGISKMVNYKQVLVIRKL